MKGEPLVSVVTPVFDGADDLVECVESILAQTYENWEYTIVDNASNDETPEIARTYASRDPRIRHLRFDDHVDATANHNRAIEAISAESEFCKVVQADDWLYPECLARMTDAAGVSDTIGVVSAYQLCGPWVHLTGLPYTTTFIAGPEMLRRTLLGLNVTGAPTATMLRSAFVRERQPFYQQRFYHHDTEAMLWMLTRHDLAFVHQVLTFARMRSDGRTPWSSRMNTHVPEHIALLLRYGGLVLEPSEYRARLRADLKSYLWWHVRQFPRLSRLRDPEFFALHDHEQNLILTEANGDPEVRAAMGAVRGMLLRGRLYATPFPRRRSIRRREGGGPPPK